MAAMDARTKKRARGGSGGGGGANPSARAKPDREAKKRRRDAKLKDEASRRQANEAARKAAEARDAEAERKRLVKRAKAAEAYLQQWKDHRDAWKFSKVQQIWVLQHMLDRKAVGKSLFQAVVLEYLQSIKGQALQRARADAAKIVADVEADGNTLADRVAKLEKKLKSVGAEDDEQRAKIEYKIKSLRAKYKRAKQVVAAIDAASGEPPASS